MSFNRDTWPEWAKKHFPQHPPYGDRETINAWQPLIRVRALATQVLCVAQTRIEGAWAAYCDSVPGINHDHEYAQVLKFGSKLPEDIARVIWPEFKDIPYAP